MKNRISGRGSSRFDDGPLFLRQGHAQTAKRDIDRANSLRRFADRFETVTNEWAHNLRRRWPAQQQPFRRASVAFLI
jgi:hypothetical protein